MKTFHAFVTLGLVIAVMVLAVSHPDTRKGDAAYRLGEELMRRTCEHEKEISRSQSDLDYANTRIKGLVVENARLFMRIVELEKQVGKAKVGSRPTCECACESRGDVKTCKCHKTAGFCPADKEK